MILGVLVGVGWSCGSNHIQVWFELQDCNMNHSHPPFYWFLWGVIFFLFNSRSKVLRIIACCNCFEKLKMKECDFIRHTLWRLTVYTPIPLFITHHNCLTALYNPLWARNVIFLSFRRQLPVLPIFLRGLQLLYLTVCLCHATPHHTRGVVHSSRHFRHWRRAIPFRLHHILWSWWHVFNTVVLVLSGGTLCIRHIYHSRRGWGA